MARPNDPFKDVQRYDEEVVQQGDLTVRDIAQLQAKAVNFSLQGYADSHDLNGDGAITKADATRDDPNPGYMNFSATKVEQGLAKKFEAFTATFDVDHSGSLDAREGGAFQVFMSNAVFPDTMSVAMPELRKRIQERGVLTTQDIVNAYGRALEPKIDEAREFVARGLAPLSTPAAPAKEDRSR